MLQDDGWTPVVTKGSHRQFKHPTKPGRVTVSGQLGDDAEGNAGVGQASGRAERREIVKRLRYLVRINKDPDSDWGASVPDLPGCVATGKTIDSTLRRIQVAIELHLRGMRADGVRPPRPRQRTVVPGRTSRQVDFYATVEVAA
jgi:predicted RNase H-like HicB family nuclease